MEVDINKMTVTELKALAWDQSLELQRIQQNLVAIQNQIIKLDQESKKESDGTEKE